MIISLSGVRGIAGKSLTTEVAGRFGRAFGAWLKKGKVVVGRDSRVSGPELEKAVVAGLVSTGCRVIKLGIVPTPTCQVMVEELKAAGGVVITASHNPAPWNGLKFIGAEGTFLNQKGARRMLAAYRKDDVRLVARGREKKVETDRTAVSCHLRRVLAVVNPRLIRKRKFKVGLDSVNGAGAESALRLLRRLGARVEAINVIPNGRFPHEPEPTPTNLTSIARLVKEKGCDVGFAQDPDADRLVLVDERGEILSEEYTLVLAALQVLPRRRGLVVVNLSTSRMIEDAAAMFGCRVKRTPVGEIRVVEGMKKFRAVFGGEGNGGVIDPRVHYGRDSLVGMALVLQLLAESGKTVTELSKIVPDYHRVKKKVESDPEKRDLLRRELKKRFTGGKINTADGVRISWPDSWLHVRPSGTEPAVRVIAEAREEGEAERLADSAIRQVRAIIRAVK